MDYILFTNAKMKDDVVYKMHRHDGEQQAGPRRDRAGAERLRAGAPASQARASTYHPGALKYFQDNKIEAKAYELRLAE